MADNGLFGSGYNIPQRRLPIYLVMECSMGMRGVWLESLNAAIRTIYDYLMDDAEMRSRVIISVITFASGAEQTPLTPLKEFAPPTLVAEGVCRLDGALALLNESIESDVILNTTTARGDYCPLVFLFMRRHPTDETGYPSDLYQPELARLRSFRGNKKTRIVAFNVGSDPDALDLRTIAEEVHPMQAMTRNWLKDFFRL